MFKLKNNTNRTVRNSVESGAHLRQITFNQDLHKESFVCTEDDIKRVIIHVANILEERENFVVSDSTKIAVYRSLINSRVGLTTTDEALTLLVRNRLIGGLQ